MTLFKVIVLIFCGKFCKEIQQMFSPSRVSMYLKEYIYIYIYSPVLHLKLRLKFKAWSLILSLIMSIKDADL